MAALVVPAVVAVALVRLAIAPVALVVGPVAALVVAAPALGFALGWRRGPRGGVRRCGGRSALARRLGARALRRRCRTLRRAGLPRHARLIGIDPGSKTLGLALTDVSLTIASPYGSLKRDKLRHNAAEIGAIGQENLIQYRGW